MKVSINALRKRISRKYRDDWPYYRLRVARGEQLQDQVGAFYVHDGSRNLVVAYEGDVEQWAKNDGVLDGHETLAAESN